jgi:hypothetical protein
MDFYSDSERLYKGRLVLICVSILLLLAAVYLLITDQATSSFLIVPPLFTIISLSSQCWNSKSNNSDLTNNQENNKI